IDEQLSIEQSPYIKAAYQRLLATHDRHEAAHVIREALGEVIWEGQRLDARQHNERYIEMIMRHGTRYGRLYFRTDKGPVRLASQAEMLSMSEWASVDAMAPITAFLRMLDVAGAPAWPRW